MYKYFLVIFTYLDILNGFRRYVKIEKVSLFYH